METVKHEYLKDKRQTLILHESFVRKIDDDMYKALQHVMDINANFLQNSTFAKIVSERTISADKEKMLLKAYLELEESIRAIRVAAAVDLQLGQEAAPSRRRSEFTNRFVYNIKYGFLYY